MGFSLTGVSESNKSLKALELLLSFDALDCHFSCLSRHTLNLRTTFLLNRAIIIELSKLLWGVKIHPGDFSVTSDQTLRLPIGGPAKFLRLVDLVKDTGLTTIDFSWRLGLILLEGNTWDWDFRRGLRHLVRINFIAVENFKGTLLLYKLLLGPSIQPLLTQTALLPQLVLFL